MTTPDPTERADRPATGQRAAGARLVVLALQGWTRTQVAGAAVASVAIALVIGTATVLIPNSWFARDIPPVWWDYPVWLLTSVLAGMLLATYLRPEGVPERRSGRFGIVGAVLGWFAVGCPVCNKIALVALGYTGALTWFAPFQPVLALAALVLTGLALYWRLRGQVACPLPRPAAQVSR